MKNDIIVFFVYSLNGGGAERVVARLASQWVADGNRVAVITEDTIDSDQYALDSRVERYSTNTGVPGGSIVKKIQNYVRKATELRKILKTLGASSVISFMCRGNNIAFLATRGTDIKLVAAIRNDLERSTVKPLDGFLRRFTYARADMVVVQSTKIAEDVQSRFKPHALRIIPNPVPQNPSKDKPDIPAARPYILGVGRLAPQKGFDLLIKAYAKSRARHQYDLMILGKGGELEKLSSIAVEEGVSSSVIFKGLVPDATPYFNECTMFVLSSHYEGFPNVLVEAMSAGCPVITFNFPSAARDIVEDGVNGIIVPLGNVSLLSEAIDRVADDGELRKTLSTNAVPSIMKFSPERVIEQWQDVLRSV